MIYLDFSLLRPLYEYGACARWMFPEVQGADQQQQVSRTRLQTAVWSGRLKVVVIGLQSRMGGLTTRPAAR
jgi:hypothetical protein